MNPITLENVSRLSRDVAEKAAILDKTEARYLVDNYYMIQEYRKASSNQMRELSKAGGPEHPPSFHPILPWLCEQTQVIEGQLKRALDHWSDAHPAGQWAKSICGIGPVLSAGLLAHIDIAKAPTVGHIWRFAGLDPTASWGKGEKRPWNASLKTLCWKIGESFVKVSGNPNDFYGKLLLQRKEIEAAKNEAREFRDQAVLALKNKNFDKDTVAYKHYSEGKLPPAHIHARAKRWAVKLFLAHYHHVLYSLEYGAAPPNPYVIAILGHADVIQPPNWNGHAVVSQARL